MTIEEIVTYIARFFAVILVFTPHEFAHAYVAYKNGDPTAKMRGRMTLNPIKHIDPLGFVTCALVGFGWAKPVPINPANFRNYKKGMITTAVAGVIMNYIIAFFAYLCYVLMVKFVLSPYFAYNGYNAVYYLIHFVTIFFYIVFAYSLCSVAFNLLPLNPLDGFRIVEGFTREINPVQRFLRQYGQMILIILIVESFICNVLTDRFGIGWAGYCNILNYIMTFATNILGFPITKAWNWILTLNT
jgi:Zn-dependent protease